MGKSMESIKNKLLHFAEIGEKYTVFAEKPPKLHHKYKKFKVNQISPGKYLIWRTK